MKKKNSGNGYYGADGLIHESPHIGPVLIHRHAREAFGRHLRRRAGRVGLRQAAQQRFLQ